MPDSCMICRRSRGTDISLHRFPSKSNAAKRRQWLKSLKLTENDVSDHSCVCIRHFPNHDPTQIPTLALGKKFRSPKKIWTDRAKRASQRSVATTCSTPASDCRRLSYSNARSPTCLASVTPSPVPEVISSGRGDELTNEDGPSTSVSPSPIPEFTSETGDGLTNVNLSSLDIATSVAAMSSEDEPLRGAVCQDTHQLSDGNASIGMSSAPSPVNSLCSHEDLNMTVAGLMARIDALEAENKYLKSKKSLFRFECISHDDSLVKFYTGFSSYDQLMHFYEFLGPAVNHLQYWGSKETQKKRHRKTKLDSLNQLFLTLIKLRSNLREKDIANRFGIAVSTVSKYFITWVCFLYQQLTEIDWMPSTEQVKGTLPQSFKEKFPDTYAIIDATEIFLEVPCDLHSQFSTWSNYKHSNTAKLLVACTPNGAVCFVSSLYVGSISDTELTRVSGFVEKLAGKVGASIMADRGFTIKDQLAVHGVTLNSPPFMEGRAQLPVEAIWRGRKIASLRIHIERVIGRIKSFAILKETLPLSMARIADQIVTVCALLVNFQPVLIPFRVTDDELTNVDDYIANLSDSEYDADSEYSDNDF